MGQRGGDPVDLTVQPECLALAAAVPPGEVPQFYEELPARERRHVDLWVIATNHPLASHPMSPAERFGQLVNACRSNGEPSKETLE